jgi:WD40 repeat protein
VFHDRNLVSIWDSFSEGGPEGRLQGTGLFSSRMAWAPDGRRLFVADENGSVRIWDIAGGQPLAPPARPLAGPLRDLALDPTGTRLALSGESGQIAVAQVNGEKIGPATILGRQKDAIDLGFGTASRFVIVRSYSNPPQVYDLLSRRPARGLSGLQGDDVAAVSPDLRRALLLPRGRDTATLIYAQDGNSIGPTLFVNRTPITGPPSPTDHERMNFRVAFDRAGRYFATAAGDKAIRLWTLDNGESAGPPLQGHEHAVSALSLSDDGQALVSIDRGGHIRAWRGPAAWPAEVCSKLVRNMSIAEWRAWVSPEIKYRCQCPGLPVAADGNQMPEQGRECAP